MKKILFFTESLATGVQSYITDLSNSLVDSFDVYLAYSIRSNQTRDNFKSFFDKRVHFIEVKNFCRELNPVLDIKAFFEVKKIAKEVKPDIIHLHSSKAEALGRFAFNGKKVPLFYTPHGYSFVAAECSPLKRKVYYFIEWLCARRRCTTISCGKSEYEDTKKLTKNSLYINNGINMEDLDLIKEKATISSHPFTVYTLGRVCYQKNPFIFNEIASKLPNIKFIWVGGGELESELKSPNITITGFLDREKALSCAINSDVFLFTSFGEALPMSLLESMYLEKPCVVSDVKGNHDVIQNEVNGFLCNTIDDYLNAINTIQNTSCSSIIKNAYSTLRQ